MRFSFGRCMDAGEQQVAIQVYHYYPNLELSEKSLIKTNSTLHTKKDLMSTLPQFDFEISIAVLLTTSAQLAPIQSFSYSKFFYEFV